MGAAAIGSRARPVAPAGRLREIPSAVSAIVMKLLAKMAEGRYQTAAGLESDLRNCQIEWQARRQIDDFPLGEHDTPGRLLIPEKLYGRQRDVEALLASFDRVVNDGAPAALLRSRTASMQSRSHPSRTFAATPIYLARVRAAPRARAASKPPSGAAFRPETRKWIWLDCLATWAIPELPRNSSGTTRPSKPEKG